MSNSERAKQFAPFDALKGLQQSLRLKEYEHEKTIQGDLSEDSILEISQCLNKIDPTNKIIIEYFYDGYKQSEIGNAKINYTEQYLIINNKKIKFNDILNIKIINS